MSLFNPRGKCVRLNVSTTTDRVALPSNNPNRTLRIMVIGDPVFVAFGADNTVTAVIPVNKDAAGGAVPVAGNRETGFTIDATMTYVAAICDTGKSASIYIQSGDGT